MNLGALALISLCAGLIGRGIAYEIWNPIRFLTGAGLAVGAALGLIAVPLLMIYFRRPEAPALEQAATALLLFAGFTALGMPLLIAINGALDPSPPEEVPAVILSLEHRHAELRLEGEGELQGQAATYPVYRIYKLNRLVGDRITLVVKRGRLGYPWIESIR